jgi:imidazolonepropionase
MRKILSGLRIATLEDIGAPYGLIENGAIGIDGERIAWVGQSIPSDWNDVERPHRLPHASGLWR